MKFAEKFTLKKNEF